MAETEQPTLGEVYRTLLALDARCEKGFADVDRAHHSLRNRQQATDLRVAVLDNEIKNIKGSAARTSTWISALVAGGIEGLIAVFTRMGGK